MSKLERILWGVDFVIGGIGWWFGGPYAALGCLFVGAVLILGGLLSKADGETKVQSGSILVDSHNRLYQTTPWVKKWHKWGLAGSILGLLVLISYGAIHKLQTEKSRVIVPLGIVREQKPLERAVVEIAGFDLDFSPVNKMQIIAEIHAKNIGPGIARNLHGIVWILPAPFIRDNPTANKIIQDAGFKDMLKSLQRQIIAHNEGPSLAPGQTNDYANLSPVLTEEQYKNWENQTKFVPYLMGEVTWDDESGEWKTDICKLLFMPSKKLGNASIRVGAFSSCDGHNGVAEKFIPSNP